MAGEEASPVLGVSRQIIVLTHTEVLKDNRILRAIDSMLSLEDTGVIAIGKSLAASKIPKSSREFRNLSVVNLGPSTMLSSAQIWLRNKNSNPRRASLFHHFALVVLNAVELFYFNVALIFVGLRETHRNKTSIVYCNDEFCLPASFFLAKSTGSRLIYDAHELEHDKNGQSALTRKVTFQWEKFFWPSIDYFITVSESIRLHYLETLGPKPSDVVLNSPSISYRAVESSSLGIRKSLGLGGEDLILVYVGFFSEGRGIRFLLDCVQELPDNYHLVFLGEGSLWGDIVESTKNFTNVHVISAVPHDELVDFISSADIGLCLLEPVSLSDRFALPNKFFEYAFARLPILYSDFPEMSRVAQRYELGEKCELSTKSFFEGITRLKGATTPLVPLEPLSHEHQQKVMVTVLSSLLNSCD